MESFGLADQIKPTDDAPFGVWPENWRTAGAFLALDGHWEFGRSADGSQHLLMPPEKIKHTLELMGVKRRKWPKIFNGLKVMESEVYEALRVVEE